MTITYNDLLEAGVHFGHLRRKWNPNMAPYIFMERNGIHIIDLNKTLVKAAEARNAIKQIAKSGKKILFVATKKQAKDVVSELAGRVNMPFMTERWPGGMLTNFATIRKAVKKISNIEKMEGDGTLATMAKRERLQVLREKHKLEKDFGSIVDLNRLPAAVFIVDIHFEHIAVAEAKKLNIPTFAIVDTNSNPNEVDFPIPANDDASKSISVIIGEMVSAIEEGLNERKFEKDKISEEDEQREKDEEFRLKSLENIDDEETVDIDGKTKRPRKLKTDEPETDTMGKKSPKPQGKRLTTKKK
ncbi:MAG: 30S ribosomal protein S2 [Bacteroidales bacterium]|nr:30S ribosomal protein S2 [Bacteroidales bacterium]